MFTRTELIALVTGTHLLNLLEFFIKSETLKNGTLVKESLVHILAVVNEMLKSLLDLKVRSMYDNLSLGFIKLGLYPVLIKTIVSLPLDALN